KQQQHLAMFPEELPRRLIKMFSFVSETILDPFLGSGTTALAAKNCDRNSIGFEINKNFIPIIKEKLGINQVNLFYENDIEFIEQENRGFNWQAEIQKLPYIFKDPIQFDKKIDPRSRNFGSKIEKNHSAPIEYFLVNNIQEPNLIELSSGELIYLLGIQINPETRDAALKFLNEKVKGQKIFLKMDVAVQYANQNRAVYVYLKNKTFINAHLIKKGLVNVDLSCEYKHKNRFVKFLN
ncbi:site-specific DNA-methyltransferase, partial [candidate division KSB1 bacterium]|nr:site-specific DNA-methyltransferase [candidate division KSB1 bacterium]